MSPRRVLHLDNSSPKTIAAPCTHCQPLTGALLVRMTIADKLSVARSNAFSGACPAVTRAVAPLRLARAQVVAVRCAVSLG